MPKPLVFISHIHQDQAISNALESIITEALLGGVDVFNSSNRQSLRPGDPWRDLIIDKLKTCSALLIVATPDSVGRPWVNFESGAAWVAGHRVIPCCAHGMTPSSLPSPLRDLQGIELAIPGGLKMLVDLLASIAGLNAPQKYDFTEAVKRFEATTKSTASDSRTWLSRTAKRPERYKGEAREVLACVTSMRAVDGNMAGEVPDKRVSGGNSLECSLRLDGTQDWVHHCFAPPEVADVLEESVEGTVFRMVLRVLGQIGTLDEDGYLNGEGGRRKYFSGYLIETAAPCSATLDM